MASMNKQWQKVERSDSVQEHFMIGEFIQSDNWESSSPPSFEPNNYPYLKDCIEFRGNQYGRYIKNEIRVTEITHGTTCENMISIIKDGGFRPGTKYIPGIGHMDLVWFGLKIEETEIDRVRENYQVAQDLLQYGLPTITIDNVVSYFACTAPFQPMSRYGNFKFTLNIREVLHQYKMQFGNRGLEMRKLGTFVYKMETMHVILVCPPGTYNTGQCPLLSGDPIIQPDESFETWTWRPHSTGDKAVDVQTKGGLFKKSKRWEHVVFTFYVPLGCCLKIANLNEHVSLCLWRDKLYNDKAVNAAVNYMLELITDENQLIRKELANMLIRMIQRYFNEMRVYAKTTSDVDPINLRIDQDCVEQKLRTLQMENISFGWSPHLG